MKDESEIFYEWFREGFGDKDVPDPLEYIALRDSISFQSYLARYRFKELCQQTCKQFVDLFNGMIRGIKYLLKNIWRESK